ncbi:MAG: TonB-dependent receptor [Xanthomonadales bacterium]|nr:TonB-dependent receptor [Xanthomonadales bacterium]
MLACCLGLPVPVFAQSALEEVIVTAQKREENLQDVSISISVLTADQLENFRIEQPADLANFTPGLSVTTGNSGDPIFALRGIGMNNGESNQNPSVTPYIDEVALPSIVMLGFQLFDLERVEVLKGPQGTLYGRNITGGAINFVTRKPTHEFDASVRANYGRFDLVELEAAVGGGVTDTLAVRLGAHSTTRDGWQNVLLGPDAGDLDSDNGAIDRQAVRGAVLWTPTENFDLTFTADLGLSKSEVLAYEHAGNVLQDGSGLCSFPMTGIRNEEECASFAIRRDAVGGDPVTGEVEIVSDPDTGPRTTFGSFSFGNIDDVESWGLNNNMNWAFNNMVLTSVTGYRELDRETGGDNGSPFIVSDTFRAQEVDLFTQELRLSSDESWGDLRWVLGAYYSEDEISDFVLFNFRDHIDFSALFDSTFFQKTEDIAVFGHAEWQFDENWKLIGGLRYTDEDRFFRYSGFVEGGGPVPLPFFEDSVNATEVTGKLGLDYQPNEDYLFYGSISRGFKGPGFPATIAFSIPQILPFDTEELIAYEVGMKSTLANNSLVFNAAGYYYDWENLQATTAVTREGIRLIVLANAGNARVFGAEAEASWFPTSEFSLRVGVNLMDAEITSGEFDGDTPVQTPTFSSSLIATYEFSEPIANVRPFAQLDYSYRSEIELALANNVEEQDGYGLLGLRAGVRSIDEKWEASLWVRNLTDKLYKGSQFGAGSTFLPSRIVYAEPRTYGASLSYNF